MKIKQILSCILIVLTLLWFIYILYEEKIFIQSLFLKLDFNNLFWLFISLLYGSVSTCILILIFQKILFENSGINFSIKKLAYVYFSSQIVRYLPGRFLGVVYQINEIKQHIPPLAILKSNIEFMIISVLLNFIYSGAMLIYFHFNFFNAALFCVISLWGFIFWWIKKPIAVFISFLKFIPQKRLEEINKICFRKPSTIYSAMYYILIYLFSWFFYLFSWNCLKFVFPEFQNLNFYMLCAQYTLAISVGIISFITPGGLGIRETFFILIAKDNMSSSALGFMSVFLRLWMMLIDFVLFILVLIFFKKNSAQEASPS